MDSEKLNILVVEDDDDVRLLICKEFSSLGYTTTEAANLSEAKNIIHNNEIKLDLFLIDIQLPDGDGFSLVKEIRQVTAEAPIIIMTGLITDKIVDKAVQNNCYDLIEKPFSIKEDVIPMVKRGLNTVLLKKENLQLSEQILHNSKLAALGELSATIVHDIRGPLSMIQLTCEDIKDEYKETNEIKEKSLYDHLSQINRACHKIKKLVDHLRNYARNDHSETQETKNIMELIEDSLFLVKQKIRKFQIKVDINIEPKIHSMSILCYPNKFEQVLMNLMSNACDAMKETAQKELTVKVSIKEGNLLLSICDTGTGIPDPIKTKIFDSFFTTKPKGEGTGLGLSIVKNIVVEHGGELILETEVGKGSTFTVKLPSSKVIRNGNDSGASRAA